MAYKEFFLNLLKFPYVDLILKAANRVIFNKNYFYDSGHGLFGKMLQYKIKINPVVNVHDAMPTESACYLHKTALLLRRK